MARVSTAPARINPREKHLAAARFAMGVLTRVSILAATTNLYAYHDLVVCGAKNEKHMDRDHCTRDQQQFADPGADIVGRIAITGEISVSQKSRSYPNESG